MFNQSLLGKWPWTFTCKHNRYWRRVVKYGRKIGWLGDCGDQLDLWCGLVEGDRSGW